MDNDRDRNPSTDRIREGDRDPLAPLTLRGDKICCSAPLKFLYLIHAFNAQAFYRNGISSRRVLRVETCR